MMCRDWKVVYIAFGFSDGGGYEVGTFNPDFPGVVAVVALSDPASKAAAYSNVKTLSQNPQHTCHSELTRRAMTY